MNARLDPLPVAGLTTIDIPLARRARAAPALALLVALAAAGCASPPTAAPSPPPPPSMPAFSPAEVAWSTADGSGTVEGVARVGVVGRAAQTCAGGEAQLVPASPFAVAMMRGVFGNGERGYVTIASSPAYPREIPAGFGATVRRSPCGPGGEFRFERVPAGSYLVFANVVWRDSSEETVPRGGSLLRRVQVAEGGSVRVLLEP